MPSIIDSPIIERGSSQDAVMMPTTPQASDTMVEDLSSTVGDHHISLAQATFDLLVEAEFPRLPPIQAPVGEEAHHLTDDRDDTSKSTPSLDEHLVAENTLNDQDFFEGGSHVESPRITYSNALKDTSVFHGTWAYVGDSDVEMERQGLLNVISGVLGQEIVNRLTPRDNRDIHTLVYPPSNTQISFFVKQLPVELRREIYRYLLVDPILGQAQSISKHSAYGAEYRYGLTPSILTVCKQVYTEASQILYEENTFIMECYPQWVATTAEARHLNLSPLTRYVEADTWLPLLSSMFFKVRNWKWIIAGVDEPPTGRPYPNMALLDMCRMICQWPEDDHNMYMPVSSFRWPIQSLEIVIIPRGIQPRFYMFLFAQWSETSEQYCIEETFAPLRLLRNVEKVAFRNAGLDDIPDCLISATPATEFKSIMPSPELEVSLWELMISKGPTELLWLIYENLCRYVKSFERDKHIETEMSHQRWAENTKYISEENYQDCLNAMWTSDRNPFQKSTPHPWEQLLEDAKNACILQMPLEFKHHRLALMRQLERIFRKVDASMQSVRMFKGGHGDWLFDERLRDAPSVAAEPLMLGIMLLEDCCDLSKRITRSRYTQPHDNLERTLVAATNI